MVGSEGRLQPLNNEVGKDGFSGNDKDFKSGRDSKKQAGRNEILKPLIQKYL